MFAMQHDEPILELDILDLEELCLEEPIPVNAEQLERVIEQSPWEKARKDPASVPFIPGMRLPFCF